MSGRRERRTHRLTHRFPKRPGSPTACRAPKGKQRLNVVRPECLPRRTTREMTGSVTGIQGISSFAGSVPEGGLPAVTRAAPARSAGGGGVGAQEPAGDQRHSAPVGCPTAGLPHGLLACESAPPGCEMDFSLRDRSAPTAVHTSGPLQLGGGGGVPGHRSLGRLPGAQPWREPLWLGGGVPLGAVPGALRSAGFCLARFCFKRFGFPVSGAPACGAPSGCVVNLGSGSCLRTTWLRPSRARLAGAERAR